MRLKLKGLVYASDAEVEITAQRLRKNLFGGNCVYIQTFSDTTAE